MISQSLGLEAGGAIGATLYVSQSLAGSFFRPNLLFLNRLVNLARLPADSVAHVADEDFGRYASSAPEADLNVIPLPSEFDAEFLWSLRDATGAACLFTQDGGDESALA